MPLAPQPPSPSAPIKKAIFPVAGLGTRLLPATKVMPKEMLTLVDKPLIQYAVEEALAAGIEEFIFITSRGKAALEDHFEANPELYRTLESRGKKVELASLQKTDIPRGKLFFTRQPEPLGLGHAVWCARHFVENEPFAVLLCDVVVMAQKPCLAQMVESYNKIGGNIIAVENVPREEVYKYGIIDSVRQDGNLSVIKGLIEKPKVEAAPSTLSIIGRYILQPELMHVLENGKRGAGGEIQLTDAMAELLLHQPFYGMHFEGKTYDCGHASGFVEANIAFALQRPELRDAVLESAKKLGLRLFKE